MAVYTEVSDNELARFIATYDIGTLVSYKGIAEGVENTNYIVQTTSGNYILTLYERRVDPADLPFFLGFMEHLAAAGVSCPLPVRDRAGQNLNMLAGRHAALITFLQGVSPRRPTPEHCHGVGVAMAEIHLAGADFSMKRRNALTLKDWHPLFGKIANRTNEILPGLDKLIENELSALDALWPKDLPSGIIHADLFPDNVFFMNDKVSGVIDYYFACKDAFAYDIAICLNAWCFEQDFAFNTTKGRALLKGYQSVRPLSQRECECMATLARGAAMRFLLTRSYDWLHTPKSALVARKDPFDYVRRLRFHQNAKSLADYGWEGQA